MNLKQQIKSANSKGKLVKVILAYQRALQHYANESHWAVKNDEIVWLGDDDPTYAASVVLAIRKADPAYAQRNKPMSGNRTNESEPSNATNP